jgi:ADP-heptose:LPS heptosyltransferase
MIVPPDWRPRSILVVRLSALGDVVRVSGVLAALRSWAPQSTLLFATGPLLAPLMAYQPVLDAVLSPPPPPNRFRYWRRCRRALRPWQSRGRIDLAIDLQGNKFSALWPFAARARLRIGRGARRWHYAVPVDYRRNDLAESALLLAALGIEIDCLPQLTVEPAAEASVAQRLEQSGLPDSGFLVVNPFGRWPAKLWPAERYAALLGRLDPAIPAIVMSGPGEREAALALAVAAGRPSIAALAGRLTLPELAALLARARLVLTGDSGPMHLAAAVGTRVLALFGPTWPQRAEPQGPGHRVLQNAAALRFHAYRETAMQSLMETLDVEEVEAALHEMWNGAATQ